jgi:hypothetical protein
MSWVDSGLEREGNSREGRVLERGRNSPEGASSPRARWKLAQGGVKPSSEAKASWCGN